MITYGTNVSANDYKTQLEYFVNKEIFDAIREKDKRLLPQTEGKIKQYNCWLRITAYYTAWFFIHY